MLNFPRRKASNYQKKKKEFAVLNICVRYIQYRYHTYEPTLVLKSSHPNVCTVVLLMFHLVYLAEYQVVPGQLEQRVVVDEQQDRLEPKTH